MKINQLIYISLILISIISCNGQIKHESIVKQKTNSDLKGDRIIFTKKLSKIYRLSTLPFSIVVPKGYDYQFNNKRLSAIRVYKYDQDSLLNDITIGISVFDKKFSAKQEKRWLVKFKNNSKIKQNPDFRIRVYNDYFILGKKRKIYTYSINNEKGKYPTNIPLNSIGITYPTKEGLSGLAIVVTKWKIDPNEPLSKIEKDIINSIEFE